jgi:hypothetical protein
MMMVTEEFALFIFVPFSLLPYAYPQYTAKLVASRVPPLMLEARPVGSYAVKTNLIVACLCP